MRSKPLHGAEGNPPRKPSQETLRAPEQPRPTVQPQEQLEQKPNIRAPVRGQGPSGDGAMQGRRGEYLQDSLLTPCPRGPAAERVGKTGAAKPLCGVQGGGVGHPVGPALPAHTSAPSRE